MKTIAVIVAIVSIICFACAFFLSVMYCTAGYMGYPDVWKNRKAEKTYYILAPASVILMVLSAVLLIATCGC